MSLTPTTILYFPLVSSLPLTHTFTRGMRDGDPPPVDVFNDNIKVGAPEAWKLSPALGSVSPFRGSANYAHAIEAPETVGGLQPALSIDYSSAAADLDAQGLLGRGWDLDLPRISRVYNLDGYVRWNPSYGHIPYGDSYVANPNDNPITASYCNEENPSLQYDEEFGWSCEAWYWTPGAFAKLDFGPTSTPTPSYTLHLNGQALPLVHVGGGEYFPRSYSLLRVRQCNTTYPCTGTLEAPHDITSTTARALQRRVLAGLCPRRRPLCVRRRRSERTGHQGLGQPRHAERQRRGGLVPAPGVRQPQRLGRPRPQQPPVHGGVLLRRGPREQQRPGLGQEHPPDRRRVRRQLQDGPAPARLRVPGRNGRPAPVGG